MVAQRTGEPKSRFKTFVNQQIRDRLTRGRNGGKRRLYIYCIGFIGQLIGRRLTMTLLLLMMMMSNALPR